MSISKSDKEINELNEKLDFLAKQLEEKERNERIAKRFQDDEDRMNSVQWTDWDFRG